MKKYVVRLSEEERASLIRVVNTEERVAARKRKRAQILLKVDASEHGPAWTDARAAEAYGVHVMTVCTIRQELVTEGLEAALNRRRQYPPPRTPVLDEQKERTLLALAQGEPPEGQGRWTLQLLADELVRLEVVEAVSYETVRKALKKTPLTLGGRSLG